MKQRGYLLLVLASFCVATLPVVGKFGLQQDIPIFALLISRTTIAATVLAIILRLWQPSLLQIGRQELQRCFELAVVNSISMFLYLQTLAYLDASLSIMLFSFIFIPFVIFFNQIWGQKPHRIDGLRFAIAIAGIYLFINPTGSFNWIGVAFGVANAMMYGVYTVLVERRLSHVAPMTILLYSMAMQAIIFSIVGFFVGVTWPPLNQGASWATMLWLGLVSTGLARLFLFSGIQIVGSKQAALFSPLDMVIALALSVLFLNEVLTGVQIVAALLIVISILLANWLPSASAEHETV
ncbi:MAG: DMT family transporter [Candidatus Promineifilaceae bacterium]